MRKRGLLVVLLGFSAISGCATISDVSPQTISQHIAAAEVGQCRTPKTMVQRIDCLNSFEDAIWGREAPGTLDIYRAWNLERSAVGAKFDSGTLSVDGFNAAIRSGQSELWTAVLRREQYASQRAQDDSAAVLVLGAAFLAGYNNAAVRSPVVTTTCNITGPTVNCLSF